MAGGAVASMVSPFTKPQDYDFFLVVPTVRGCLLPDEARVAAAMALVAELEAKLDASLHAAYPSGDGVHPRTLFLHRDGSHVVDVMAVL